MLKQLIAAAFATMIAMPAFADTDRIAHNKEAAVALLKGFYGGKPEVITDLVDDVYIQHSAAEDGRDALVAVVTKGRDEGWLNEEVAAKFSPSRVIANEEYAAVHYLDEGENRVYIDIFRFNDNGKIGEHWDHSQENSGPNKSGRDMVSGPSPKPTSPEIEVANMATVKRVYDDYFGKGDVSILPDIINDLYIQHSSPNGEDGLDFFAGLVDRFGGPFENTVHKIFAEGDMVVIHGEYPGFNLASMDVFRLKDGKIVEHWDVIGPLPETLPHDNGHF